MKVAFQGELGAYSEIAARALFGDVELSPVETFEDVFRAVNAGECDRGVVPIENSLTGSVHRNYDLLLEHPLWIVGEVKLRIVHHLIALPGVKLEDVKKAHSHPQALEQCRAFLRERKIEPVPVYDTAGAVRILKEKKLKDSAAIASIQAARDYGMDVLVSDIAEHRENFTRFLAVGKEPAGDLKDPKTSVVFALKNIPGALFKALSVFALRDIDLVKIESRPIRGKPWQYMFYLDFEGGMEEERCRRAVDHLGEIATFLRVLGSYDKGREVEDWPYLR
ncbi:MAG: prephenate dehydratase [Candidatus Latescibacterota bacterium]|nr:MAG: prephenate dehydratase [Candidatus Latescibacterota bacterium]